MAGIATKHTLPAPFHEYELDDAFDEMVDSGGAVRSHYRHIYEALRELTGDELRRRHVGLIQRRDDVGELVLRDAAEVRHRGDRQRHRDQRKELFRVQRLRRQRANEQQQHCESELSHAHKFVQDGDRNQLKSTPGTLLTSSAPRSPAACRRKGP